VATAQLDDRGAAMTGDPRLAELPLRVTSAVPGRVRLRLLHRAAHGQRLAEVAEALEARPEVFEVLLRASSGSIIVRHDAQPAGLAAFQEALSALGVPSASPAPPAAATVRVQGAALAVNGMVARGTGSDLRLLAPLTLGLLSLRRAMRDGPRIGDAPWYVLAWYAWGTYSQLNAGDVQERTQDA